MKWLEGSDYQELTNSVVRRQITPRTEVVLLDEWIDGESRRVVAKLTDEEWYVLHLSHLGYFVKGGH